MVTTEIKSGFRVIGCGCKSSFCPDCCKAIGWKQRQRLMWAITRWQTERPVMLTLTVDQHNFRDAEEAQRHVKKKRLIGRLLRDLRKQLGFKHSYHVVEWQKNGWPHWHVLVDCSFVPFAVLDRSWNKLGPGREGCFKQMGLVWISKGPGGKEGSFVDRFHAAMYVTKYLMKPPKHGYPEWLLAHEDLFFKRYQGSKDLFTDEELKSWIDAAAYEKHWEDHGFPPEWDGLDDIQPKEKETYERSARSIRGRVAKCGSRSVVLSWSDEIRPDGEIINRRRYKMALPMSFDEVRQVLNRADEGKQFELTTAELETLREIETGEKSRAHYAAILREQKAIRQCLLFDKSPHVLQGVGL